ncbi:MULTISPECIES: YqgQ family protein [Bacillaceae]|uniref:YqgQ family protein n=1 Tax=Bacillaceae TaxID=186817 RepID=UPI000C793D2A|nr:MULTISPECIES: YqgQ family protein [Bacillaceae]PLR68132.1 DUF910 domain-containing protein [Bacillus sp. UMB0893]QNG61222.1 YqgQ family protein [Bacillus sp. PAMC26568]
MKTVYDVQQLLKKYGTIIYIGNRAADLELMEMEVRQLFESGLIEVQDFQMAILLLRQETQREKDKEKI